MQAKELKLRWIRRLLGGAALALVFLFLVLGVLWISLPSWIDSQDLKEAVCQEMTRLTGYRARLEALELSRLSILELKARGLTLEKEEGTRFMTVARISARLGWRELLRGELALRSLTLEGLELNGPIVPIHLGHGAQRGTGVLEGLSHVRVRGATIGWPLAGGRLLLRDVSADFLPSRAHPYIAFHALGEVAGEFLQGSVLEATGRLSLDGSGSLWIEGRALPTGELIKLLFPQVEAAMVSGEAQLRLELQGVLGASVNWSAKLHTSELQVSWPGILDEPFGAERLSGNARGTWRNGAWTVDEAVLKAGDLVLEAQLRSSQQGVMGTIQAGPFNFHRVIPHLGRELVGPALYGFFREELLGGRARGVVFTLSPRGNGQEPPGVDLVMELQFEEAALRFDPGLPPLESLSGTLVWQADKVWFKDLQGSYRGRAFQGMEARITEIGRVSLLEGRFSLELSWPEVEELFVATSDPKPTASLLSGLEGGGVLDLAIKKAFLHKDPLKYQARIKVKSARGKLPGGTLSWQASSGELLASGQKLEIHQLRGTLEMSPWELNGVVQSWGSHSPVLSLTGSIQISPDDLKRQLYSWVPGLEIQAEAATEAALSVQGDLMGGAGLEVSLDLSALALRFRKLWEKPMEAPLHLKVLLSGAIGRPWVLVSGDVRCGGARIQIQAQERKPPQDGRVWRLVSRGYSVQDLLQQWVPVRGYLEGGEVDVEAEILPAPNLQWRATLWPRNIKVASSLVGKKWWIRSGKISLDSTGLEADSVSMETDGVDGLLDARVDWPQGQGLKLRGRLRGKEIDLDRFLASEEQGEKTALPTGSRRADRRWLDRLTGSALELAFERMRFLGLELEGVQAQLAQRDGALVLRVLEGQMARGRLTLEGHLTSQGKWELSGGLEQARADLFLSKLGIEEAIIQGSLRLRADIGGYSWGESKGVYGGQMDLEIQKGLIRRFPVLANILSVMNLTQLLSGHLPDVSTQGMLFDTIRGTFQLDKGVLRTEDLRVESQALVLTMVGEIDLRTKQCDLKVGAQPFVGVDRFVDKLPVIRHYLAGPKRTVLATYFLVRGPLDEPEVTAIPFRSLGETVMGIFLRLFQNPFGDLGPPGELPDEAQDIAP